MSMGRHSFEVAAECQSPIGEFDDDGKESALVLKLEASRRPLLWACSLFEHNRKKRGPFWWWWRWRLLPARPSAGKPVFVFHCGLGDACLGEHAFMIEYNVEHLDERTSNVRSCSNSEVLVSLRLARFWANIQIIACQVISWTINGRQLEN